jgi:hypothetical protein
MQERVKTVQQRYEGAFPPEAQVEQDIRAPYIARRSHPVPVTNYLNAECMLRLLAL